MLAAARGDEKVNLLLRGGKVVDLFEGRAVSLDVAVHRGLIVGFGDRDARDVVDVHGGFIVPGFIDGHVHVESSLVSLPQYARAVVPRGTTAVVTDFHEIANVLGLRGIRYMRSLSEGIPLDVFIMAPSCVPATPMETAGAVLDAEALRRLRGEGAVIGLGEVMNFPGVIGGQAEVLEKIEAFRGSPVDGHAPGVRGKDLDAYLAAGVESDHECVEAEEAAEKLAKGMYIYIREGSTAKNMADLLPVVPPGGAPECIFVTDDRQPEDLLVEGHMDALLRKSVSLGMDPVTALRMVTLNTARRFRLERRGAVAPGWKADLVILEDLEKFKVLRVYKDGRLVAEEGRCLYPEREVVPSAPASMKIAWDKTPDFTVKAEGGKILVIGVIPDQIITEKLVEDAPVREGKVVQDPSRDLLKICVLERHNGTGNLSVGFVKGFGLRRGALASTVAHDSHNLMVVGASDAEMMKAAKAVERMGGGQVVVEGEKVLAELPLDVAGLMSTLPLGEVAERVKGLRGAAGELGCRLKEPFMTLSFMALPVIPELKITDRGLFDVSSFRHVSLFDTGS